MFFGWFKGQYYAVRILYYSLSPKTRQRTGVGLGVVLAVFGVGGYAVDAGYVQMLGLNLMVESAITVLVTFPWNVLRFPVEILAAAGLSALAELPLPIVTVLSTYSLVVAALYAFATLVPLLRTVLAPTLGRLLSALWGFLLGPICQCCAFEQVWQSWKSRIAVSGLIAAVYTATHMEINMQAIDPTPTFLSLTLARTLAITCLSAGAAAFLGLLRVVLMFPPADPHAEYNSYPLFAALLHAPVLLLQLGPLRAAASEVRSHQSSWSEVAPGLYTELFCAAMVLSISGVHLAVACTKCWPAPTRALDPDKMQQKYAQYRAGRHDAMTQEDIPEGLPTLYVLFAAAGYVFVCALFTPHRIVYAVSGTALGILAAHFF